MGKNVSLTCKISSLIFKNPVIAASGAFGYGHEFRRFVDLNKLGGFVVKGLSLYPREGNESPRVVETPCGMLNAIGLQNIGVDRFLSEKLPMLEDLNTHIIANIYGSEVEEFIGIVERLNPYKRVSAVEVNVSCPNVKKGGSAFGKNPDDVYVLTAAIKRVSEKPVIVKLTPNVTDISIVAQAAASGGADAVSLINTITGMVIDTKLRRPVLANVTGGLSGPCIYPVGVRMVYEVKRKIDIPIIGIGGIYSTDIALQYIMAGASMVEVGTANFIEPDIMVRIIDGLEEYLRDEGVDNIADIVGICCK